MYFDLLKSLFDRPFFTAKEAKSLGISHSLIAHYIKTGVLTRLHRGVYKYSKGEQEPISRWSDLVKEACSIQDGIICLNSALAIYGLIEELPKEHWIAIPHRTSMKKRNGVRTVRMRNTEIGRSEITIDDIKVSIFDRERTIVDSFRFLSFETAIRALKTGLQPQNKDLINLNKITEYSKKLRVNIKPYLAAISI